MPLGIPKEQEMEVIVCPLDYYNGPYGKHNDMIIYGKTYKTERRKGTSHSLPIEGVDLLSGQKIDDKVNWTYYEFYAIRWDDEKKRFIEELFEDRIKEP